MFSSSNSRFLDVSYNSLLWDDLEWKVISRTDGRSKFEILLEQIFCLFFSNRFVQVFLKQVFVEVLFTQPRNAISMVQ